MYPQVITVLVNQQSQETEECHQTNPDNSDKRHELVGPQSDLDEDSDDDDVRDVSEAVNISMQKKNYSNPSGQSHSKVLPSTGPNYTRENKPKMTSKSQRDNLLNSEGINKGDNSSSTRRNVASPQSDLDDGRYVSVADYSKTPPDDILDFEVINKEDNLPPARSHSNAITSLSPTQIAPPPFPPIPPKANPSDPNSPNNEYFNATPGAQRPSEVSL